MDDKNEEKLDHVQLVSSQDTNDILKQDGVTGKAEHSIGIDTIDVNERKTLRKIDLRVLPMVTILYLLSFLDRGYVKVEMSRNTMLTFS